MARQMTEEENKTFSRMLQTIRTKARRNQLRTDYRESLEKLDKMGFSIPPSMEDFQTAIGWADKAVKVPARRIRSDGFTLPRPSALLTQVEEVMNEPGSINLERMTIDAALEHSVSFHFVTPGDPALGEPKAVQVSRPATEATCEIDIRTGRTTAALEILSRSHFLMYLPGKTLRIELEQAKYVVVREYNAIPNRVTCTPFVWDKSLKRPFGRSRITRPLMGYIDAGIRTMLRQEVNAEFYGAPQRALLGAEDVHFRDAEGNRISPLDALIGGLWALPDVRDEETGDLVRPKIQQLTQASFAPHSEMLRTIAMQVSSETSIPIGYLGVIHDNPSSADAIRAAESDLASVVTDELPSIGASRADVARNIAAVLEGQWTEGMEKELRGLHSHFMDPGTPTKAEQADAGLKYVQTFPEGDPEVAMEIYGLSRLQIERNMRYMRRQQASQSVTDILLAQQPQQANGNEDEGNADTGA